MAIIETARAWLGARRTPQAGASVAIAVSAASAEPATWVPPGHFYSPLVDAEKLRARADIVFAPDAPLPDIDLRLRQQLDLFRQLAEFYPDLPFGEQPRPGVRYGYENDQFGYGDAMILAAMLRHFKPKRFIEVGSGFSSAVTLDINERFLGGMIDCTFVEPYPVRLHALMTPQDQERVTVVVQGVEDVPTSLFSRLQAGDMLFIDSTHVSKCDSDVNHHFFRILPSLAPGVIIHFHDVFYPFEYPPQWFFEGNRSWNELYLLRAFLMNNAKYEILFFSAGFAHFHGDAIAALMPMMTRNTGGSFWMRKVSA